MASTSDLFIVNQTLSYILVMLIIIGVVALFDLLRKIFFRLNK